jgi:hypothetical protein
VIETNAAIISNCSRYRFLEDAHLILWKVSCIQAHNIGYLPTILDTVEPGNYTSQSLLGFVGQVS